MVIPAAAPLCRWSERPNCDSSCDEAGLKTKRRTDGEPKGKNIELSLIVDRSRSPISSLQAGQ
jgi:hypothetical protein